jgi:hypothetical protein
MPSQNSRSRTPARRSYDNARTIRAVGLCVIAGAIPALASSWSPSLQTALVHRGLRVDAASVRWIDPPGPGPRRALVLAQEHNGLPDVYAVTAHTGTNNCITAIENVSNLTRSPEAAEQTLILSGRWGVFATSVGTTITAFTLVDTHGSPDAHQNATQDRGARARAAITRWQQTGRLDGYGVHRYDLTPTARTLRMSLSHNTLHVTADARTMVVDAESLTVREGQNFVQSRPRLAGTTGWLTWFVDSVRAISWVGPEPIAWAEHVAFGVKHKVARARNRVQGDRSQSEVAEDLADVLHGDSVGSTEGRVTDWPPPPITTTLSPPLEHEGTWSAAAEDDLFIARNTGAPAAFYQSFVRTDRERPDTRVYVTLWDARQVELHVVPGSQEPIGLGGENGTGSIPVDPESVTRVAGGFNGGFQALHGEWGLRAEGVLFLPPKPWGATMLSMEDGSTGFGSWPNGVSDIPTDVVELRQNLTALVEDGVYNPFRRTFWGGNVPTAAPGDEYTARTGICLTREGHVAYFWGDDLTPRSLADGMIATRCAYGIHLDMNGANTGFEFLRVTPNASTTPLRRPLTAGEAEGTITSAPNFHYRARRMVRGMHEIGFPRYIKRDPRDFFYLLLRPVLPGSPIASAVTPAVAGEGQWHVTGVGDVPFPWPASRTRVRPDASQPDRWVNLVRIDPRRVSLSAPEPDVVPFARILGPTVSPSGTTRIAWTEHNNSPRWEMATQGFGIEGAPLITGMAVTRGICIDRNGFMVYAVADRALPGLVSGALTLAGCVGERLAVTQNVIALTETQDIAGATISQPMPVALNIGIRPMRGGFRAFPEVRPVSPNVWYDAQHRRVRYVRNEDGTIQANTVNGLVNARAWGSSSSNHDAGTPVQTPGTP